MRRMESASERELLRRACRRSVEMPRACRPRFPAAHRPRLPTAAASPLKLDDLVTRCTVLQRATKLSHTQLTAGLA